MPLMNISDSISIFLRRWGPALLIMLIIFVLSSIPSDEMPDFGRADTLFKKLGHMAGYALLALAVLHGLNRFTPAAIAAAWGLTVLYAVTDEFHQSLVPGRGSSIVDVGIDALGALLGLLVLAWVRRMILRQSAPG
jgi:VanZ family protein